MQQFNRISYDLKNYNSVSVQNCKGVGLNYDESKCHNATSKHNESKVRKTWKKKETNEWMGKLMLKSKKAYFSKTGYTLF